MAWVKGERTERDKKAGKVRDDVKGKTIDKRGEPKMEQKGLTEWLIGCKTFPFEAFLLSCSGRNDGNEHYNDTSHKERSVERNMTQKKNRM